MKRKPSLRDRREFIRGVTVASIGSAVALNATAHAAAQPRSGGAIVHAQEGQLIPKTPDGRQVTVKIDSELTPGVRMSVVTEDLPPNSEIRVHLHRHEDEIIVIRMGSGIATLGEREVAVAAGAIVYVPQGVWHGLGNNGTETLGRSAIRWRHASGAPTHWVTTCDLRCSMLNHDPDSARPAPEVLKAVVREKQSTPKRLATSLAGFVSRCLDSGRDRFWIASGIRLSATLVSPW